MDFVGAVFMMGFIITFILALQCGGQTHPWKSSVVIGLLVGCFAILFLFVAWEMYQKERAIIVPRLICSSPKLHFCSGEKLIKSKGDEALRCCRVHLHVLFCCRI